MSSRFFAPLSLLALVFASSVFAQNPSQRGRDDVSTSSAASVGGGATTGVAEEDFAIAQSYDEAGATSAAIAAYRRFIKNFPASPLASKAQFREAELLEASGSLIKAFDAYQLSVTRYPDTPEFEKAVARQVVIANDFLQGRRLKVLGWAILPGTERSQKMYEAILKNAPFSKHAPVAQFNLGLSFERLGDIKNARLAYQTVLDKYPTSDVADDALYQIGYIYMETGRKGDSKDLSALILARETFEDFLLQYPKSEKVAQARDNLAALGSNEAGDLLKIAEYYDWKKDYKAAVIYYNDIIRKQPNTQTAELAKTRIEELRSSQGEDALRVGSERAESGEQLALRRRLQAQVETSALADYSGPPKRDIVPDELPISRTPNLRTNMREVAPVEPLLPTQ